MVDTSFSVKSNEKTMTRLTVKNAILQYIKELL